MNHNLVFLIFSAFAALVSAAMWLDYFRRIDVFEKEKTGPMLVALLIGGLTSYLCLFIYKLIAQAGFYENGKFLNDLLYAVLCVGLNEELSKIVGVIIALTLLKKYINEPIDVLIYAGVTALGFSMIENYHYFNSHGVRIITSRTFYSALEHIINTTIIVYGFYRQQLFKKGRQLTNTLIAVSVAVLSHGLFDFFLNDTFPVYFTAFLSIAIYLIGINFWIQMLNNANNYSSFFNYNKIRYSNKIATRLFLWYGLTLLIAFVNNTIARDLKFSLLKFLYSLVADGFLFFIVILRVSRFKIFKQKYFPIMLQFPFYITKNDDQDFILPVLNLPIKVRGESFRERLLTKYLNRPVELNPVDYRQSFLEDAREALITNKYLLFDEVIVYTVSIKDRPAPENILYVLKPKTSGDAMTYEKNPIEGLFEVAVQHSAGELQTIDHNKLRFIEWVYLKVK